MHFSSLPMCSIPFQSQCPSFYHPNNTGSLVYLAHIVATLLVGQLTAQSFGNSRATYCLCCCRNCYACTALLTETINAHQYVTYILIPFCNTSKYSVCCTHSVSGDRIISTQFWPPLLSDLYTCPFSIVRHVKG